MKVRASDTNTHHRLMMIATIVNVVFVLSYMAKSLIEGQTSFLGPQNIKVSLYLPVVIIHSIISILVLILSFSLIYTGLKWGTKEPQWSFRGEKTSKHRKFGKYLFIMWYIALISGIIVYLLLYVVFPQQ